MRTEMIENHFILNGRIMQVSDADMLPSVPSQTIYEVIRVMSGVPLFLEKHMERLEASARLIGCSIVPVAERIGNSIQELIKANNNPEKNIKILVYNLDKSSPDYMLYFIHSSYPTAEEYAKGVHAILLREERTNPNAKIVNLRFKERVAAALSESKAYEALLVNCYNEITEGSRSNVFFVRNDTVYTAPKGKVLIGITRVSVFELCNKLGIEIIEKPVSTDMLKEVDGIFITGTSPKILPISTVGEMRFDSADNKIVKAIMKSYDKMIEEYVNNKKSGQA